MDIKKTITKNAQSLIAIGTVIGMAIGVVNFFLLNALYPIQRDVQALEEWKVDVQADIKLIPVISSKLDTLKEDTKDIKSLLGVR